MQLQLALDQVSLEQAVEIVDQLQDFIDIVEIGTPLIFKEGLTAVTTIKNRFSRLTILADLKIVDGGAYESKLAFEAGADVVTVLALAHDVTVEAVIRTAQEWGGAVMVDMLRQSDIAARISQVENMGAGYICVHTASDLGGPDHLALQQLEAAVQTVKKALVAAAGGITLQTIGEVLLKKPDILVVGGGIMNQPDRRQAAAAWQRRLQRGEGN